MKPLVSVVIPCYRQARYLSHAVESALAQTHESVEVIVVNDGSDDDTEAVAKGFGDRIHYLRQENRGLPAARNAGFAASSGAMIQFLDADDVIDPRKVELQAALLDTDPDADVCLSEFRKVEMCTGLRIACPGVNLGTDPLLSLTNQWETEVSVPIHCALFRRKLWDDVAPFHDGLRAREDWVMWCALAVRGSGFCYTHEQLAEYRVYSGNMCSDWNIMITSLIDAARIIRPTIPDSYRRGFDDHVLKLLIGYARRHLLLEASDYRALYEECKGELNLIETSRAWRIVRAVWKWRAFACGQ